ncbi:MAG: hypothetical protein PWQ20_993 [Thermotogaceae bacterium]|nr:hypothetical protein [Thermotogaceae bacterium]
MNLILLLPKIPISENQGILIGEILIFGYMIIYILVKKKGIPISLEILLLFVFFTYNIIVSSLINGLHISTFPLHALLYYLRVISYFILITCAYNFSEDDVAFLKYYFLIPFFIGTLISLSIMITRYIVNPPSVTEILWGYSTGLRNTPIYGYSISKNSFLFLKPIGGGSGNLLCSWNIAVLIITRNIIWRKGYVRYKKIYYWVLIVAFINVMLSFSRGGFLTLLLVFFYYALQDSLKNKIDIKLIFGIVITLTIIIFLIGNLMPASILDRLGNTIVNGKLDPSSYGRIENYKTIFHNSKVLTLLFGSGFDEIVSKKNLGVQFAESFYLDIFRSSGILGLVLFMMFLVSVFKNAHHDIFLKSLAEFLALQSIIMWTITGGDFFSAPVLYFIFLMLGRSSLISLFN